ncbi:hypothetical protein [Christiangramia sabulilitoris]|uniref:DUF748 domain-containing protein n=1 Tax=Christiangramia sabulilitoris TaxID=2583991 RepID=A0A550HZV0_9FLAO|nr:hypothetical protein [Christiangramia sabulilitoris]TRO64254.1 hypothetical protein FGM01_12205 [Christiangramia sabulilitoris]
MNKKKKIGLGILIGILTFLIALLVANNILEKKIKKAIEDNLSRAKVTFKKVDVKLLDRSAEVIQPFARIKGKTLSVDTIKLNNIHLWDYISNKDIIVGDLEVSGPVVKFFRNDTVKDTTRTQKDKTSSEFKNKILVKRVKVKRGTFQIFEEDTSMHRLYAQLKSLEMEQLRINAETLKETVPFNYDLILLNIDSLFYDLNAQQELSVRDLVIDNNELNITGFRILPKYSKEAHQNTISVQKDRYDLTIDSVYMSDINWSLQNDTLKLENPFTRFSGVDLKIYRDKLQPEDNSAKYMYSRQIRNMPVHLSLDSLKITDAYIKYEENIHPDKETGIVEFSNLNASIKNITNLDLDRKDFPKTLISIDADFMKSAPLHVDWEFDISNTADAFQISGSMGRLAASEMNKFLQPAMNVEATGEILDMYFNFYGNNTTASGDMRLEYKDFKVQVMRKDGKKKNKFVSALANLIVKNKALNDKANHKDISFTRDKTKSFWNYLWNLIKNGALKAFL